MRAVVVQLRGGVAVEEAPDPRPMGPEAVPQALRALRQGGRHTKVLVVREV